MKKPVKATKAVKSTKASSVADIKRRQSAPLICLLYTSDAADE